MFLVLGHFPGLHLVTLTRGDFIDQIVEGRGSGGDPHELAPGGLSHEPQRGFVETCSDHVPVFVPFEALPTGSPFRNGHALRGADTYAEETKRALLEMHRQVGVAHPAADGLMYRGLMIRHLVMPNGVGGTRDVIEWIAGNLPEDTYVNLMSQYRPM